MTSLIAIYIGGILTLLLAMFHTRFYREFNWEGEFRKITLLNARIIYTVHLALLLFLFALGLVSIVYAKELSLSTGLAFGLNILLSMFWLWRFIWQLVYFKWENGQKTPPVGIILLVVFAMLFISYLIPIVYRLL